jgi:hypothetical protein
MRKEGIWAGKIGLAKEKVYRLSLKSAKRLAGRYCVASNRRSQRRKRTG